MMHRPNNNRMSEPTEGDSFGRTAPSEGRSGREGRGGRRAALVNSKDSVAGWSNSISARMRVEKWLLADLWEPRCERLGLDASAEDPPFLKPAGARVGQVGRGYLGLEDRNSEAVGRQRPGSIGVPTQERKLGARPNQPRGEAPCVGGDLCDRTLARACIAACRPQCAWNSSKRKPAEPASRGATARSSFVAEAQTQTPAVRGLENWLSRHHADLTVDLAAAIPANGCRARIRVYDHLRQSWIYGTSADRGKKGGAC